MKRILYILLLAMTTIMTTNAKDEDGHRLTSLWAEYRTAAKADRPREQAEILEKIKRQAEAEHLAWDYYDACHKYVEVRSRSNWKLREDLKEQMDRDLDRFGEPVAIIYDGRHDHTDSLLLYIREDEAKLKSSSNPEFWSNDYHISRYPYGGVLPQLLSSDYDYALWHLFSMDTGNSAASALMHQTYGGTYPLGALVRYTELTSREDEESMKTMAAEHDGDAVGILAEGWLLGRKYRELEDDSKSTSEDFRRLFDNCREAKSKALALKGTDKLLASSCLWPDIIIKNLTAKEITSSIEDGEAIILLSNLGSAAVQIKSGRKTVFRTLVKNPVQSFHVFDTVRMAIPKLDDGEYEMSIYSDKTEYNSGFEKHTLSIASRNNSAGLGIYVADYISGKPLDRYTLTLLYNGKPLASAGVTREDGFTAFPKALSDRIGNKRIGYSIQASCLDGDGTLRKSKIHRITAESIFDSDFDDEDEFQEEETHCLILTDRSAFRPDETVHFKTVLYSGSSEYKAASAGIKLTATLRDAENKEISRQNIVTGDHGSAAGEFTLEKRGRGGLYSIAILQGDKQLCSTSVLVDEFVTPDFTLSWDKDGRIYLPGDGVSIKGGIQAYSGHKLGQVKASYNISRYGDTVEKGPLAPGPDGRFEIKFRAGGQDWSHYAITVKVSDATGETLEFTRNLTIRSSLDASASIIGTSKGSFSIKGQELDGHIISTDRLRFCITFDGTGGEVVHPSLDCSYKLTRNGKTVSSGPAMAGQPVEARLDGPGLYLLDTRCSAISDNGKKVEGLDHAMILYVPDSDNTLHDEITSFFKEPATDSLDLQIGASCGPIWAIAELYGDGSTLLDRQDVSFEGIMGKDGSIKTIHFTRRKDYPSELSIKVLWFKDKECFDYSRELRSPQQEYRLPLSFSRFLDTTAPGKEYTFSITTLPGVECAATIFDAATETLRANRWNPVKAAVVHTRGVTFRTSTGSFGDSFGYMVRGYGRRGGAMDYEMAAAPMMSKAMSANAAVDLAEEEVSSDAEAISIRENFAGTVAWEPFLRSDKDGKIEFSFRNADKLSTYIVQLFAHNRQMHSSVLRAEMTVTIPIKVSLVEPLFLYEGDRYVARVSVSNSSGSSVKGKATIRLFNGKDYRDGKEISSRSACLEVQAGGSSSFECPVNIRELDNLGILASFVPDDETAGADAVFVSTPVYPAVQTITESHSALFKSGEDRDSLVRALRTQFANAGGSSASVEEISILQMLQEALPALTAPSSDDVLSLSETIYADHLLTKIPGGARLEGSAREEIADKILAARNPDGGFGWFKGMNSSPVVTATLLERLAKMGDGCPEELRLALPEAVKFLDRSFLSDSARPLWCGGISLEQYLYIRSMFPEVKPESRTNLKEFRKAAKNYLIPSGERGLNGLILAKARRIKTLKALLDKDGGDNLADFFGIRAFTSIRLRKSLEKDLLSLAEYAEPHKSGGMYYPNAVMPWRGLLESELYAHSMLCDLLAECGQDGIAEGIRLWIMVQKETQQWENDPAYIEALASVLNGSEKTLQTRVIALSLSVSRPFGQVKASGNGFTVSKEYRRDGKLLNEGDTLHVGDKISVTYNIWNEENRSFVKLTAPRCAAFRPVEQRSGNYGWAARPLHVYGWVGFTPQGYRSVLADRTEYWFDSYPEEKTSVTEEFFVTQEGTFQTPSVEIESLYAPHYRANSKASVPVQISSTSDEATQP